MRLEDATDTQLVARARATLTQVDEATRNNISADFNRMLRDFEATPNDQRAYLRAGIINTLRALDDIIQRQNDADTNTTTRRPSM